MSDESLTLLERNAITHALAGSEMWKRQLLEQLSKLSVSSREETGAGFYTYFSEKADVIPVEIPPEAYSVAPQYFATHPDIPGGVFFLVWLRDGRIECLEAATGTATRPDDSGFVFS